MFEKRHASLETRIKAIEDEAELLRLREQAGIAEVAGERIDTATGEILAAELPEAEPADYPEPAFPQEPEPDYTPYEGPEPDEFLPDAGFEAPLIPLGEKPSERQAA